MTPVELVLSKLPDAKRNGQGWQARCPAHDDRHASLSVSQGDDGRALVHCHARCSQEAVVEAMGLSMRDLMPDSSDTDKTPRRGRSNGGSVMSEGKGKPPAKIYPSSEAAIAELGKRHGKPSSQWTYSDGYGDPLGVVVRWDLPGGGKDIKPVSRNGSGWVIAGMPEPRPLYDLPSLSDADRIYVVEGEKAADAARSLGLIATTSPHGAKSAAKADWQPLAGRDVLILPDNDPAGGQYAEAVAHILCQLQPPATVRVVDLPDLPEGGDFVEFAAARANNTPEEIRAEVNALAGAAEVVKPTDEVECGPVLVCLANVEPRAVRWLWPGRVPLGRITLLVGRPGEGKSFLTIDMAARVTTRRPWPDGTVCPSGSVILVCAEDDPGDTIRPRLDAHNADVQRVHLLSAVRHVNDEGEPHEVLFTLNDVAALESALQACPDCQLIVVDPIGSFLGGKTDAHRDNEVRSVLAPVARLAEKYGPAVLVVAHRRKSPGSIADDLALGSRAFTGIARSVWHLARDSEDKARRLLLPGKNNLAAEGTGLAFRIVDDPPVISWEPDPVTMSADDALAVENSSGREKPGPEPKARNAAEEWLRELLNGGPTPAADVKTEAKAAEYSWRTVQRASDAIEVVRRKCSFNGGWTWELPPEDANPRCQAPREQNNLASCHLGENDSENAVSMCQDDEDAKSSDLGTFNADNERERGEI